MINQSLWAGLSVKAFFGGYNWLGESPKLEPTESQASTEVPSWLSLTIADFLSQSNWYGSPLLKHSPPQTVLPLSITLPVHHFFQLMVWEANSDLAFVAQEEPTPAPLPSDDLKLTDLSDLF